jgi:hypothetical protein
MIPHIQFGLGIYDDKVKIRFVKKKNGPQIMREITSVEDFTDFIKEKAKAAKCEVDDLIIMCSSSMDFPEESTKNKKTIKLAHALR